MGIHDPKSRRTARSLLVWLLAMLAVGALSASLAGAQADRWNTIELPRPRYVATGGLDGGNDCTTSTLPCATLQHAVDVANPGDEIRVASGVYTGVQTRAGVTQIAYISKTVAVRGGYTTADWLAPPDPAAHPTTLDAQGKGRVLYVTGDISPTIRGLRLTGGKAGSPQQGGQGGGLYAITATLTLSQCHVFSNTTYGYGQGGGIYLGHNSTRLEHNTIHDNSADTGGGLYIESGAITLSENLIFHNVAGHKQSGMGGGLQVVSSTVTLYKNTLSGNTAAAWGGGLAAFDSDEAMLDENTIVSNTAVMGGGLYLGDCRGRLTNNLLSNNAAQYDGGGGRLISGTLILNRNSVISNIAGGAGGGLDASVGAFVFGGNMISANTALQRGGGLNLYNSRTALINTVIGDNRAGRAGSGIHVLAGSLRSWHATIARNTGGDGSAVLATGDIWNGASAVALTNTILVSHTVGINVTNENSVTVNGILWHRTPVPVLQAPAGAARVQNEFWGAPAFAADGYHLTAYSRAINQGVDAGVTTDIDGETRPHGAGYDLGADEFLSTPIGPGRLLYLPLVIR